MDRPGMEDAMRACGSLDLACLDLLDDAFFRDFDVAEDAACLHSMRHQWERPLPPRIRAAHQAALNVIEPREAHSEGELSPDELYTSRDRFADRGGAGDMGCTDPVIDGLSFSDLEAIDGCPGSFLGSFAGGKPDEGCYVGDESSSPCSAILEESHTAVTGMKDSHCSDQTQSCSSLDLAVLLDELEGDQGTVEAPRCLDSLKAEADEMFSLLPELDLTEEDFLVLFAEPAEPSHSAKVADGSGGITVEGLSGRGVGSGAASALLSPALRTAVARAALKSAKAKLSQRRGGGGGGHDQAFLKVAAAFEAANMAGAAALSSSAEAAEDATELAAAAVRRALEERFPVWTKLMSIRHQQPQRSQFLEGSRMDPQVDLRARIRRLLLPEGAKGPIQPVEASSKTCLKDRLRQCASKENLSMIKSSSAGKSAKRSFGEISVLSTQLNSSSSAAVGSLAPKQEASQQDLPKKSTLGASSLQPILDLAAKRRRLDASSLTGVPPAHPQALHTGPGVPAPCNTPRGMPQDCLLNTSPKAGMPLSPAKAEIAPAAVVGLDPGRRTLLLAAASRAAGKSQPGVRAPVDVQPVEAGVTGDNQRLKASSQMQATAAEKMGKRGSGSETRVQLLAAAARTGTGAKPAMAALLQGTSGDLEGVRLPQECSLSARLATVANQLRRR